MKDSICPKCSSPMQLGFQADGVHQTSVFRQATWAPGPPELNNDWTVLGVNLISEWVLKIREEDLLRIVTMRCTGCGFLEHYAPNPER